MKNCGNCIYSEDGVCYFDGAMEVGSDYCCSNHVLQAPYVLLVDGDGYRDPIHVCRKHKDDFRGQGWIDDGGTDFGPCVKCGQ